MPSRTPIRAPLALLAFGLAALAAAGCGGEAGRAQPTVSVVTVVEGQTVAAPAGTARITDPARAAYVKRVDAVCAQRNPERDADVKAAAEAPTEAEAVAAYDRSIATAETQLREVRAVSPPAGDAALIRANVTDRLEQRIALRRRISAALAAADPATAGRLRAQLDALTTALEGFARGYGFAVCGRR